MPSPFERTHNGVARLRASSRSAARLGATHVEGYASGTQRKRKLWNGSFLCFSLAVRDIEASKLFYEKLGFTVFAGEQSRNWLIMKNGDHAIGLFQGMFDKNILTFNPGWSSNAQQLREFTDVREWRKHDFRSR